MAADDSLLLHPETHLLGEALTLPRLVANAALDNDPTATIVELSGAGGWERAAAPTVTEVRGLSFQQGGPERTARAVTVAGGSSDQALILRGCRFDSFTAAPAVGGAVVGLLGDGGGLPVTVDGCAFTGNVCRGPGGAIYVADGYDLTLSGTELVANASERTPGGGDGRGGAICVVSPVAASHLSLTGCHLADNQAWGNGGAIAVDDAGVELTGTTVLDSRSAVGGLTVAAAGAGVIMRRTDAAHADPLALVVRDCRLEGNQGNLAAGTGAGDGGGILVRGGEQIPLYVTVTIEGTEFVGNYNAQGGGLYIGRFATGTVSRCRFLANVGHIQAGGAAKGGAGEVNTGETVVFEYCEFTGNRAGVDLEGAVTSSLSRGGGLFVRHFPRAELYHCTFSDNEVAALDLAMGDAFFHGEGGVFDDPQLRCAIYSCVFYGPGGNSQQVRSNPDGFSAVDHCAFAPDQYLCSGVEPTNPIWLDASPFVAADDPHLVAGAPCIDAAPDLGYEFDLDGVPVPQGDAPDVGAYEWRDSTPVDDPGLPLRSSLAVQPNPFNPRTEIVFELRRSGPVALTVFDVRGRRAAVLLQADLPAGRHRCTWDGTDAAGRAVAAGVYYGHLVAPTGTETVKMTLVR